MDKIQAALKYHLESSGIPNEVTLYAGELRKVINGTYQNDTKPNISILFFPTDKPRGINRGEFGVLVIGENQIFDVAAAQTSAFGTARLIIDFLEENFAWSHLSNIFAIKTDEPLTIEPVYFDEKVAALMIKMTISY